MTQWLLVLGVVLTTIGGDLLQAREMQKHSRAGIGETTLHFFRRPLLIASILCMALSFGAFLLLLQVADLSFAVPATAASLFSRQRLLAGIFASAWTAGAGLQRCW
jgi:hypothetical protein